ncbi:IS5/IS1182 family transposase, partial [Xanthomonas oryzae pv. oryzae]
CAAGDNIRRLLRAMVRLGLKGLFAPMFARLIMLATVLAMSLRARNTRPHRLAWCVW